MLMITYKENNLQTPTRTPLTPRGGTRSLLLLSSSTDSGVTRGPGYVRACSLFRAAMSAFDGLPGLRFASPVENGNSRLQFTLGD